MLACWRKVWERYGYGKMAYFPLFVELKDRPCLIVGGGKVALRKAKSLLEFEAKVKVAAPNLEEEFRLLHKEHKIELYERNFEKKDLDGCYLVVAATDQAVINQEVARLCRERGIMVNVADNRERSSFLFPGCIKRSSVVIGITTSGESPALTKRIRQEIETLIDDSYGEAAKKLGKVRNQVKSSGLLKEERKETFHKLVSQVLSEKEEEN